MFIEHCVGQIKKNEKSFKKLFNNNEKASSNKSSNNILMKFTIKL